MNKITQSHVCMHVKDECKTTVNERVDKVTDASVQVRCALEREGLLCYPCVAQLAAFQIVDFTRPWFRHCTYFSSCSQVT